MAGRVIRVFKVSVLSGDCSGILANILFGGRCVNILVGIFVII